MRRELLIAGGTFLVLTLTAIGIGVGLYLGSSDGTQSNETETDGTQSNETETAPVNCKVDSWLPWSDCTVTCGNGTKTTTRKVLEKPQHGGEPCPPLEVAESCNTQQCPVDCKVEDWSAWSDCSATCGGGVKTKRRGVIQQPESGGDICPPLEEAEACDTFAKCIEESVVILKRKQVGNPVEYFNKNFAEYESGFASGGESWLGLKRLHQLTSQNDYSLYVSLTDFDGKTYSAFYDRFQVGPGDGYQVTVTDFNDALSTLGDSLRFNNGMKFSTKDKDQDTHSQVNCAETKKGGGWWVYCGWTGLTGVHTSSPQRLPDEAQIHWHWGGERGNSYNSWKEAEMRMIPK